MAFNLANQPITDKERELRFLRHLAVRIAEGGTYLTVHDKAALKHLQSAHCQDTAETSVLEFAQAERDELDNWTPKYA